jgi:CheY-like chemotaxis protein
MSASQTQPVDDGLVVVVEDDRDAREGMVEVLEAAGVRVRAASEGWEALACMAHEVPALVITDLVMPNLDGWALVESLSKDGRLGCVPICVVTAVRAAAPASVAAVLRKPIDVSLLLELVR